MCCYCALRRGLCIESFFSVGCYECKDRRHLVIKVREFAKLKRKATGSDVQAWPSHGWAGLPESLIDHIMTMAVGRESV